MTPILPSICTYLEIIQECCRVPTILRTAPDVGSHMRSVNTLLLLLLTFSALSCGHPNPKFGDEKKSECGRYLSE
jgi:hypothetical protein